MGVIGRHLTALLDFQGREGRREFWPWAVFVALACMALFPTVLPLVLPRYENLAADPDILENQLAGVFHVAFFAAAIAVALSAAAVVRRLRDAGRGAVWAISPLVLMAGFPVVVGRLWAGMLSAENLLDNPYARCMEMLPGFIFVTLASWAVLVVLLGLPSRDPAIRPAR